MNAPLRFEPYLRPMVWGGRQLGEVLGKPLPNGGSYGESWEISDHPTHASIISHGPHKGQTLRHWMEHQPAALLGEAADTPFAFSRGWSSCSTPGTGSRCRSIPTRRTWFGCGRARAARPRPGSCWRRRRAAGSTPACCRASMRSACATRCARARSAIVCTSFAPRPGDCVFLPAGTVHAVGGGVLMAEVQQTSDATFRLFDWNRRDAQGQIATTAHRGSPGLHRLEQRSRPPDPRAGIILGAPMPLHANQPPARFVNAWSLVPISRWIICVTASHSPVAAAASCRCCWCCMDAADCGPARAFGS